MLHYFVATGDKVYYDCKIKFVPPKAFEDCPDGQVINITTAIVGYIKYCVPLTEEKCAGVTLHPEIMGCNGQQSCNFNRQVLDNRQPPVCRNYDKLNFIFIMYNCVHGKRFLIFKTFN